MLGGGRLKAEAAAAHLELDGGDGDGRVVAVVDGDLDLSGLLEVGAEGGGDAELDVVDGVGAGVEFDLTDDAVDEVSGVGGGSWDRAERVTGDADFAAEVWVGAGGEGDRDALDGDALGEGEVCDGLPAVGVVLLLEVGGLGGDGEEGLGLAAGGHAGAPNHLRSCLKGAGDGGAGGEGNVEEGEAGLLEMEGCVAREMLGGEVEEVEAAEGGSGGRSGGAGAGDDGGGAEVLPGEVEVDLGVGAGGHGEVEVNGVAVGGEMEDAGGLGFGGLGFAEGEDERELVGAGGAGGGKTEIFEEGFGVGEGGGVEDGAGLPGSCDVDGAPVVEGGGWAGCCRDGELQESEGEQGGQMGQAEASWGGSEPMSFTVPCAVFGGTEKTPLVVFRV